jgi:hypothetical protein
MSNFIYKSFISKFLFLALIVCGATAAFGQTTKTDEPVQMVIPEITEFTYQGRLVDNNLPANGNYDFQFRLTDGEAFIGTPQQRLGVTVVNGIFTVRLDFGLNPAGTARFLEIGVRPVGNAAFTVLSPQQPVTATPYAIHSANASVANFATNATNATNATFANTANQATSATSAEIALDAVKLGGIAADQYVLVVDSRLTDERNPLAGSPNYIQNTNNQQTANFNINGTGSATLFSALTINSALQYSLGGAKFITAPTGGNTFVGLGTGAFLTTGVKNSFFGNNAGQTNAEGSDNSFFGFEAGKFTSNGIGNSFFGSKAGLNNSVGLNNTFIGANAGLWNVSGNRNVFIGQAAGNLSTGDTNTMVGANTGSLTSTGWGNTFIGYLAGDLNQTGSRNTLLGWQTALQGSDLNFATAIGAGAVVQNSNSIQMGRVTGEDTVNVSGKLKVGALGTAGGSSLCRNGAGEIAQCSSSIRYKTNIESFTSGLDLIRRLRPVSFTWKQSGERDLGFVAEEVNAVEPLMTTYNDKGQVEGIKYDRISTALVNAVNEQQTEIDSQKTEIRAQKKQIDEQQTLIQNQQRRLNVQQKQIDALMKLVCPQNAAAEVCREKE